MKIELTAGYYSEIIVNVTADGNYSTFTSTHLSLSEKCRGTKIRF